MNRWITASKSGEAATAEELRSNIDIPSTWTHVETIVKRYGAYKSR